MTNLEQEVAMFKVKKVYLFFLLFVFIFETSFAAQNKDYKVRLITKGLHHPWSSAFLPNGDILITELSGKLKILKESSTETEILNITGTPKVLFRGQGGLSDIILHPDFIENHLIYLSFSSGEKNNNTLRVMRFRLDGLSLGDKKLIFEAQPFRRTSNHYGARLLFIEDGSLLISSGDGFNYREKAQFLDNHYGKILRVNDDGSIPDDNPFVNKENALPEIWSYGHRNPQGLIYNSQNKHVYIHEHGPRGGDELNKIEPSLNYGWPAITYGIDYNGSIISPFTVKEGMEQPIKYWVPSIAPSDMSFYNGNMFPMWNGSIFISALVPGDVRRIFTDNNNEIKEEVIFDEISERVRSIKMAPDGSLLLLTDGPNGKVIRIEKD